MKCLHNRQEPAHGTRRENLIVLKLTSARDGVLSVSEVPNYLSCTSDSCRYWINESCLEDGVSIFSFFLRGKMKRRNRDRSGLNGFHKAGNLDFCWAERTGGMICGKKTGWSKGGTTSHEKYSTLCHGVCQLANRQHSPFDHPFQSLPSSKMGSG